VCGACSGTKRTIKGQGKVRVCESCTKLPADWTPTGKQGGSFPEEFDSDSDVEVIYELEAKHNYIPDLGTDSTNPGSKKLGFKKGDIVSILVVDSSGWWLGELPNGERGWVPQNYLAAA